MGEILNNAQLELLKLFSTNLSDEEIGELRKLLIEFRYQRLQQSIDKINLSKADIEEWGKAHDRKPYRSQEVHSKM
jgi:hypothetical protein